MKRILLPLTSLRFFAVALVVVLYHRPRSGPHDWLPYEWHGPGIVAFFFLLSGFILTYTYHDRFVTRRPRAIRNFLVARLVRVLPAYVLAFVIVIGATVALHGVSVIHALKYGLFPWKILAHLTLVQSWIPNIHWYYAFNPPAWSLSSECFFYLTFPLLLLGLATGSLLRRVAVFAAFSAVWVAVLGLYLSSPVDPVRDELKWMWLGYVFPLTRVFDFACGAALGVLFVRLRPNVGPARGWRYWAWGLTELGALGALWATLHFCPVHFDGNRLRHHMLSAFGYYLPASALLVWVGALGRGPLSRAVSWSPLVYLGELSYGIYIFHFPLLSLTFNLLAGWGINAHVSVGMALTYVATVGFAALSYHFWETPIRRWVHGRPKAPAAPLPLPASAAVPERRAA
jgi:peptidoglycan/LPS O-acetylase OafA/YrhL